MTLEAVEVRAYIPVRLSGVDLASEIGVSSIAEVCVCLALGGLVCSRIGSVERWVVRRFMD